MSDCRLEGALTALHAGELRRAAALCGEHLADHPADYPALCLAGVLAYQAGEPHAAKMRLCQAVAADGDQPEAFIHLADLFAAAGEFDRAELYYHAAWAAAPDSPTAVNELLLFYQQAGLPYAAKQAARQSLLIEPDQPVVADALAELETVFPDRSVTLYIPCYNAARYLDRVLPAAMAQSYPLAELLVIDDGSTDDSVAVAARFPVRIVQLERNGGLARVRNVAVATCRSEYLASLDSDVVPDPHWLERLMLHFESERLAAEAGEATGAALGGVMGRMTERHDVGLANQWRSLHCAQHHGDAPLAEAPECYGCNGVWRHEAIFRAGGFDERFRTNGEDSEASRRVRGIGYRLAYEPAARCSHLRRDSVASILDTAWRYHVPYFEHLHGIFDTATVGDVLHKRQENLVRHHQNLETDNQRRSHHLAYLTFLGLPWRVLKDFQLKARRCSDEARQAVRETHTAVYLGMFAVLAEYEPRRDLWRMVYDETAPCRPEDEALAAFCSWERVEQTIAAAHGDGVPSPLCELPARCAETVSAALRLLGEVWEQYDAMYWNMVRASALRLADERAESEREHVPGLRVAIVNAPWSEDGRIGVRAGSRWPFTQDARGERIPAYLPFPFFLATAAAMSRDEGFETLLVDAIAEGLLAEEFINRLEGWAPDIVLMETATASHELDLDWALRLKERLGSQVNVVFCGPHATALANEIMAEAPMVDAVVLGEFEPSFLDLLRAQRDGAPLDDIPGLLWRDDEGAVHIQPNRRKLPKLSEFPWPERVTLPMYNYFDSFANAMPWPNVQMHASRGCPYQCIFCVWPQVVYDGQNYRTRDNAEIVAEMKWLVERYGFRAVYFDDDTFNIKNERIIDLCDQIAAAELGVPICAMARADTSSREAFAAMARAGVVGLKFGVETGDPAMMERIRKGLDLERVRETVGYCQELGIGVHLTFSFGGPGETHETAQKTIDLAVELDPDTVQFSLMTPFPGTSMFADASADGTLLTTDWKQYDGARYTVVQGLHMSREELEETLRSAHRQWLLHLVARDCFAALERELPAAARVRADELADLADGAVESLQLLTPLNGRADLDTLLDTAAAKLRPGGVMTVLWHGTGGRGAALRFEAWQSEQPLRLLRQCSGFNDEIAVALQMPAVAAPRPELVAV